jgi:hypothetical protein
MGMQSRLLIVVVLMMSTMQMAAKEAGCGGKFVPCELHSWTDAAGQWRFSLLPHPSGVALSADLVLDKKFTLNGIEELRTVTGTSVPPFPLTISTST